MNVAASIVIPASKIYSIHIFFLQRVTINSYEISKFYYTSYFLTCEQFSKWPSSPICLGINTFVACRKSHVWAQLARKRDEGRGASTRRERNSSVVNGALVKVARSITAITRREPARIRTMLYWRDSLIDTFLLFPGDLPPAIPFFLRVCVPSSITRALAWDTREPLFRRNQRLPRSRRMETDSRLTH